MFLPKQEEEAAAAAAEAPPVAAPQRARDKRSGRYRRVGPSRLPSHLAPAHVASWHELGLAAAHFETLPADGPADFSALSSFHGMEQEGWWRGTRACQGAVGGNSRLRCSSALDFLGRFTRRYGHSPFTVGHDGREAFLRPPGRFSDTGPLLERLRAAAVGERMSDQKLKPGMCTMCVTLDPSRVFDVSSEVGDNAYGMHCIYPDGGHYIKVRVGQRTSKRKSEEQKAIERELQQKLGTRQTWMPERAHRLVLWCVFGPPAEPGKRPLALHMCGNAACLNPEHLLWGDYEANNLTKPVDAARKFEELLREQGRQF